MKKRFLTFVIILLFMIMLILPKQVLAGATDGLLLWFQIVLPTLLPFMIVTNLLISTNAVSYISRALSPLMRPLFGISRNGCFPVLAGFLCGYPMGAKVTGDMVVSGQLSKTEGKYLLSFCNNTSPMFIISYVVIQNLHTDFLVVPSICILFISALLGSFIFRHFYRKQMQAEASQNYFGNTVSFHFRMLDSSIMNSFEAMVKVGGYIILFSILLELLRNLQFDSLLWNLGFLPMIEITNGVPALCSTAASFPIRYTLIMFLTAFGGFCSIAQTKCMVQEADLPILPYIIEKLVIAGITSLLAYIFIYLTY